MEYNLQADQIVGACAYYSTANLIETELRHVKDSRIKLGNNEHVDPLFLALAYQKLKKVPVGEMWQNDELVALNTSPFNILAVHGRKIPICISRDRPSIIYKEMSRDIVNEDKFIELVEHLNIVSSSRSKSFFSFSFDDADESKAIVLSILEDVILPSFYRPEEKLTELFNSLLDIWKASASYDERIMYVMDKLLKSNCERQIHLSAEFLENFERKEKLSPNDYEGVINNQLDRGKPLSIGYNIMNQSVGHSLLVIGKEQKGSNKDCNYILRDSYSCRNNDVSEFYPSPTGCTSNNDRYVPMEGFLKRIRKIYYFK